MPQVALFLLCLLQPAAPPVPKLAVADTTAKLDAAIDDPETFLIRVQLPAAALDEQQARLLRGWVELGGTALVESDAARWFGFETAVPTNREKLAHGRRAAPLGALPLLNGVEDVYCRLDADDVLLVSHPSALPLLRVYDPVVDYPAPRYLAAEVPWGQGTVVCLPSNLHLERSDGAVFAAALARYERRTMDDATVPIETLTIARDRLAEARRLLADKPAEAQKLLDGVWLAYRLWYGDYLITAGNLEQATTILSGVAQELPEDPAVYLAVARLNDSLARPTQAAEARQRAAARYKELGREAPKPDAAQVRVPWAIFAESVTAMGQAWEQPTAAELDRALARTDFVLGLDRYRRVNLTDAAMYWREAQQLYDAWPLPSYYLGLLNYAQGQDLKRASRDRAASYTYAAGWFARLAEAKPSAEFPAPSIEGTEAWRAAAEAAAAVARQEPPAVVLLPGIILRYNDANPGFSAGPLAESLRQAFAEAYRRVTAYRVWPDDLEVLCYDTTAEMTAHLPETGVGRQAFSQGATVGRRVYTVAQTDNLNRLARHHVMHAMCNALTEDGLPAPIWFQEGLAWSSQQHLLQSQLARTNLGRGQVMSVAQLNSPDFFYDRRQVDHSYGQSQLMVEALIQRFGVEFPVDYLRLLGWGTAPEPALQALTELTQEQFLAAFLQGRLGNWRSGR